MVSSSRSSLIFIQYRKREHHHMQSLTNLGAITRQFNTNSLFSRIVWLEDAIEAAEFSVASDLGGFAAHLGFHVASAEFSKESSMF